MTKEEQEKAIEQLFIKQVDQKISLMLIDRTATKLIDHLLTSTDIIDYIERNDQFKPVAVITIYLGLPASIETILCIKGVKKILDEHFVENRPFINNETLKK